MTSQPVLNLLSSDQNAIFMCHKCMDRLAKMKQINRKSIDANITGRTAPSFENKTKPDSLNDDSIPKQNNDNNMLLKILATLEQLNGKFDRISCNTDDLKELLTPNKQSKNGGDDGSIESDISNLSQNLISLHAKVDHHFNTQLTSESKTNSIVIQMINEMHEKMNPTHNHVTKFISRDNSNGRTSILNSPHNKATPNSDPINWSFSFNQSMCPNDNAELYQLLSGFEQNTWASFDYLRHKVNENNDTILNIESICKKFNSNSESKNSCHHLDSPMIDSIKLDTLQSIHDKCEALELNFLNMNATINTITGNSTGMNKLIKDAMTQTKTKINSENPEPFNSEQKTLSRNSSAGGPSVGLNINTNANEFDIRNETVTFILDKSANEQSATETIPNSLESRVLNAMSSLDSLKRESEIYLAKLRNNTTCDDVEQYIAARSNIDTKKLKIFRLTKKNQDLSKLSFVSFKIETCDEIANLLLNDDFWPPGVSAKYFEDRISPTPRLTINQTSSDFLARANSPEHKT